MEIKEIIKLKAKAKFNYAIGGNLYYSIETDDVVVTFSIDMTDKDDVGTTTFVSEYKPITLMRYIRKSIKDGSIAVLNKK